MLSSVLPLILAAAAVNGLALDRRQLAPAATKVDSASAAVTPIQLADNTTSIELAAYEADTSTYYLGYREADFAKDYAK